MMSDVNDPVQARQVWDDCFAKLIDNLSNEALNYINGYRYNVISVAVSGVTLPYHLFDR
jgi:hypothetical protein